ncbi:MAG TPA: PilZ domain-containing protein [Terriglobales bacterium]|jgi:hypothetical protein
MPDLSAKQLLERDRERRRTPRFCCRGEAEIICLPSDGSLLTGKVCNLGRGGCYIETVSPLAPGARAEILLRVNDSSFRAIAQVRTARDSSGIGVEFVRMSSGGYALLEDLILHLERFRIGPGGARFARGEKRIEPAQEVLASERIPAFLLDKEIPIIGTILPPTKEDENPVCEPPSSTLYLPARVLDIII